MSGTNTLTGSYMYSSLMHDIPFVINPRRACAARVTVVVLCVCVCVSPRL